MPPQLNQLIRCPECQNPSFHQDSKGDRAVCPLCGATYSFDMGVLDLLPEFSQGRSISQMAMENHAIVNIYESRFWRRSPIASLVMGLTFEGESKIIQNASSVQPDSVVLDLACGPGIYTRPFAHMANQGLVVGLDLSFPMLRYGVKKARNENLNNLAFVRASAMDLPFLENSFDVVNCCGALHLFPDYRRALKETGRVLASGGRFTCAVVREFPGIMSSSQRLLFDRVMGVKSFTGDRLDEMLQHAGFKSFTVHHESRLWMIVSATK